MNSKTLMSTCAAVVALSFAASAATLKHRWSFNGDLNDSVGGATAVTIRSSKATGVVFNEAEPVFENNAVKLGSDNYALGNATSLNLGENLATGNNVTIEIWGTRLRQTANMRLFDWGNGGIDNTSPSQYLCFPWNDAPTIWTYGKNSPGTIANCFADNVKYHVVLTVTQEGTSSKYHLVRRNAADVSDVKYVDYTVPNWTLSNVASGRLYLGHSQWVGYKGNGDERDIDANATYDEVRIWDGVLSDAQIAKNAADGPDKIEMLPLAHRWSFNGDLSDSVGGATAITIRSSKANGVVFNEGDPVFENNAVKLGSDNYASGKATSLNLGENLIRGNDITLEIWGTRLRQTTNMRLFDWGTGGIDAKPTYYVCVPWNDDSHIWAWSSTAYSNSDQFTGCFENNVKYHVTLTVTQDGTSSKCHLVRRDTANISDMKYFDHTIPSSIFSNATTGRLYLGHSQWTGVGGGDERDIDANAAYDEVRIYSRAVPDALLALNAAMGPDALVLSYDEYDKACLSIPANATLPVNANTLGGGYVLGGKVTFGEGAKIQFDTANYASGMTLTAEGGFVVPSGSVTDYVTLTDPEGFAVTLNGNTISVAPATATSWTGGAGDGSWNNAGNWTAGVPTSDSDVTVLATATTLPQTAGACKSFTVYGGTLSADCDWSGLAVKPVLFGTVDLNGHALALNNLSAASGAAFANGAAAEGQVRFPVAGSDVAVTEATFIDGLANLTTASNVKIAIVKSGPDAITGTLNVGAANHSTVFRAESGTISMTANGLVGTTSGGSGSLEIAGGTVDFCTANDRGLSVGGNSSGSSGARATMNISSGKLRANWIDAGSAGVVECSIVQTGGEVETGINNNGNLWIGRWPGGNATYTMSGGVINVTRGTLAAGTYGTGTFVQDGGDVNVLAGDILVGAYRDSNASGSTGTYTLNDGTVMSKLWLHIGRSAGTVGTFTQNNGTVTLNAGIDPNGNWVALADVAGGNGAYTINNGTLEVGTGATGGGIFAGSRGTGRFTMNGGTVITPTITEISGNSTVVLNGGTIKVAKDGGTANSTQSSDIGIIKNIDNLVIMGGGTTIDTNGHDTKITGCGIETSGDAVLTKTGDGTLTVDAIPPVATLNVTSGTLALASSGDNSAPATSLAHRWSFNGNLNDSVGTSHATALGKNVSLSDSAATLNGTTQGTGSINLGSSLVLDSDVTIEIWGRCNEVVNNGRLVDWGPGTGRYLAIPWTVTTGTQVQIWVNNGGGKVFNSGTVDDFFTPGGETGIDFHIAFTIRKDGTSSVMRLVRRKTSDLSDIKELNHTVPNWALSNISGGSLYLGRSQWVEPDAHATYDEVRIWRGVLSDDALALSAATGPDATAAQIAAIVAKSAEAESGTVSRTLNLASGGTLDLGGNTLVQPSLVLGGGTVAGGTLVVNGTTDLHVGDSIANSGTIDLSGATFNLVDPEKLAGKYAGGFTFIRGGTIVGKPTVANLPKGWNVVVSGDKARIGKLGIGVIVR